MSNVSFSIGGRRFTVACAAGEEAHIAELGRAVDSRVAALGGPGGQGETRMLLFAALTLADELHEQHKQADERLQTVPAHRELAARLTRIAEALENMAGRLEAEARDD